METFLGGMVTKARGLITLLPRYFTELTQKYPDGKIQAEDFKKIFHLAFPERKQDKVKSDNLKLSFDFYTLPFAQVDQLAEKLRNVEKTDGTIRM